MSLADKVLPRQPSPSMGFAFETKDAPQSSRLLRTKDDGNDGNDADDLGTTVPPSATATAQHRQGSKQARTSFSLSAARRGALHPSPVTSTRYIHKVPPNLSSSTPPSIFHRQSSIVNPPLSILPWCVAYPRLPSFPSSILLIHDSPAELLLHFRVHIPEPSRPSPPKKESMSPLESD
jgi:hypothetical protein